MDLLPQEKTSASDALAQLIAKLAELTAKPVQPSFIIIKLQGVVAKNFSGGL